MTDEETGAASVAPMHGPDEDCAACYECRGCGGADGSMPKRWTLVGGYKAVCDDCNGSGVRCPYYDPNLTQAEVSPPETSP